MTSIDHGLNLGTATRPGFRMATLWPAFVSLVKRYRNRREVAYLQEFTDLQLADIGLTRSDFNQAVRGRMFDDHSKELARTALLRRTLIYPC